VYGLDALNDVMHRAIVPKGVPFPFSVDNDRANLPGEVLNDLMTAYENSRNPGKFHVQPVVGQPEAFDLVPYEFRDAHGNPHPYTPLLDMRISLPSGKRRAFDVLRDFTKALSQASGLTVDTGAGFNPNTLIQLQVEEEAQQEMARDYLRRFMGQLGLAARLSWQLKCDPEVCVINVHQVFPPK
jgi:hypothetical protein